MKITLIQEFTLSIKADYESDFVPSKGDTIVLRGDAEQFTVIERILSVNNPTNVVLMGKVELIKPYTYSGS